MFWCQNGNNVDCGFFFLNIYALIYRVLLQFSFMLYLGRGGRNGINKRDRREISGKLIRTYQLIKLTVLTVTTYLVPRHYRKENE
jgi:hypothetical protein